MIGKSSPEHERAAGRVMSLLIVLLLLVPSAIFLAHFGDLPRFGELHDDSVYFVSAKSLAEGHGYRIESLPGEPAQTKYPPLYPLLLSLAWRITPEFPQNLLVAGWLSWLALPVILVQLAWVFPKLGFSPGRTRLLLAVFALNPYVILFSTQLLTEMWFLAFVLAAVLALERALERTSVVWAVAAGLMAGLAYLTRSAGVALFAAALMYLWLGQPRLGQQRKRQQRRLAISFAAVAAPFAIGWMVWASQHRTVTNDPELIYYLDYFRYQLYAISWRDMPLVLWKNVDGLLWGLGGMILPKITGSLFLKILAQVIGVAMISGIVRLVRRGLGWMLAWFAAFSAVLLLTWHFPPNERLVLPLFPLALAGLMVESEHFVALLRASRQHKERSQRIAARAVMGFAGAFLAGVVALQVYVGAIYLPDDARQHRASKIARDAAYPWIKANTPREATLLSADDAMMYLNTGRHAMRRPVPPFLWYREDHAGTVAWLGEPGEFARQHGLTYLDFAGVDASLGVDDEDGAAIAKKLAASPDLEALFHQGSVILYGVRPQASARAADLRTEPHPAAQ